MGIQVQSSPISDIASLVTSLGPLFIGSGKKTETTSGNPAALATNDQLLQTLFPMMSGNAANDPVVQNILQRASIDFAPALAGGPSSGLYNTTTINQLASEASARAVGEASSSFMNRQIAAAQVASNATGNAIRGSTTGTSQTAPAINPLMLAALVAGGFAVKSGLGKSVTDALGLTSAAGPASAQAKSALGPISFVQPTGAAKKLAGTEPTPAADNAAQEVLADPSVNPAAAAANAGDVGASTGGVSIGTDTVSGSASGNIINAPLLDIGATGGDLIPDAATGGLVADALSGGTAIGGLSESALAAGGADFAATDAALGSAVGTGAAEGAADVGLATGAAEGGADAVGAAAAGDGLAEAGTAIATALAWIICTELMRQGKMPRRYWYAGSKKFASYWEYGKRGYYLWAIPSVRHLRAKPDGLYSRFLGLIFNRRAEHLAACIGVRGARKSVSGFLISHSLYAICAILAVTVCQFLEKPDWQQLYKETA